MHARTRANPIGESEV